MGSIRHKVKDKIFGIPNPGGTVSAAFRDTARKRYLAKVAIDKQRKAATCAS